MDHTPNAQPTHVARIALNRARRLCADPAVIEQLDIASEALDRMQSLQRTRVTRERAASGRLKSAAVQVLQVLEASALGGVTSAQLSVLNVAFRARISELRAAGYRIHFDHRSTRYFLRPSEAQVAS